VISLHVPLTVLATRAPSSAGAAIGILRERVATTAYYGVADVRLGEPVAPETLFSVGSLTKSMVATVIARLARAGRLSLDDPVAAHMPELNASGWARGQLLVWPLRSTSTRPSSPATID
jgi:CubicO group peptidase (beta-lactamase class C family)